MKRYITTGDATSLHNLGCHYYRGRHGLPKSNTRAMELWQRAGELGHSASYYNIARVYQEERSDEDMASRYYALAAVGGYMPARIAVLATPHHILRKQTKKVQIMGWVD